MPVFGGADLKQRTLSALVLAPLVLLATYAGGLVFAALWILAGLAVLYEWANVARLAPRAGFLGVAGVALLAALALVLAGRGALAPVVLAGGMAGCAVIARSRAWAAAGLVAGAAVALPAVILRDGAPGFVAVLFLYGVVWATDVFAYFVGRALGGPKLWPRLSPNKTWSGAVGGTLAGALTGLGVALAAGIAPGWPLALLAVAASIAGQAGDLAESAFKRRFGVKDAGRLIPGHGGIMDRLDGFAAAAVVAVAVGMLHNAADPAAGLLVW